MELLYHLPLSIWATRGLLKGIFKLPFFSFFQARARILRTSYMLLCISLYPGLSSPIHPPDISISNAISANLTTYLHTYIHTFITPNRKSHHITSPKTKEIQEKKKRKRNKLPTNISNPSRPPPRPRTPPRLRYPGLYHHPDISGGCVELD